MVDNELIDRDFFTRSMSSLVGHIKQIEFYEQQNTQRAISYLRKKAASLGFELVPQTINREEVS